MSTRNRNLILAGVGAAAAVIALVLILVSVVGNSGGKKVEGTPVRTVTVTTPAGTTTSSAAPGEPVAVPGAAATAALFRGIPQKLNQLGDPNAPVTMIEFADLQCPFCKAYTLDALPGIVRTYVRTGKIKLVFSGMHFIGPDSEKALRTVYAAGIQGKLWNVLDLLYKSQGAENSGWVTDSLLTSVGKAAGVDTARMKADAAGQDVDAALQIADQQANQAHVNSTPTFFAGPTGQTLQHLNVTALTFEGFRPLLDPLVQ
jgi:protein-disulfide isomerase